MAICYMSLVISTLVSFSGVWAQSAPGPSYAVSPSDTTGVVGYSVTIYCTIANLGYQQVFWNVDQISDKNPAGKEFTLGPNVNSHASYQRFQIVGNSQRGEYNLQISTVTQDDAGTYTCIVHDPTKENTAAMEAQAVLTIQNTTALPFVGYPDCDRQPTGNSQYATGIYMKGDVLTLTCSSRGGVPHPQLSWVRVQIDNRATDLKSTSTVSGDVITATAKVILSSLDDQSFYKCIETHPAWTTVRKCMTPFSGSGSLLDVRFPPEVAITPKRVTVQLLETTKVTLSCTAYANPLLSEKPEIILPENKTGRYPLNDKTLVEVEMTTDDVGKDFYCRASNALGIGEDNVEVIRLRALPTWLILVIIGAVAIVLFIFIGVVASIWCVDRSNHGGNKKDTSLIRNSSKKSRPTSMRHEGEEDFLDDGMVPIDNFQGGRELEMEEGNKPVVNPDFETGETGPRYQNIGVGVQQTVPEDENVATVAEPDVVIEPTPSPSLEPEPL